MTVTHRLRAAMPWLVQRSAIRLLSLCGALSLLIAVGCSDDVGPDRYANTTSGGSSATSGARSEGGATGSNGSGGATSGATGGSKQASTSAAGGGSSTEGSSVSSDGGTSARASGGATSTGGTPGAAGTGGTVGGQSSGGSRSSSTQGSGGQGSGGNRSSSTQSSGGKSSGGSRSSSTQSSSGGRTGGSQSSGSAQSSGGSQAGGSQSSSASTENPSAIGPSKTCGCLTSSGNYSGNPLTATIVVNNGETYDGGCKTYITKSLSSGGLGDGSQEENQKPLFRVNAGGKLINVIIGAPAADGVHFYGNATAQNIHWLDIGEDAATIKDDGTVTLDCGSAKNGSDKVFQVNAKATWNISNFTIKGAGKAMRENGGECYPVTAVFDHCDISSLDEVIFRTDCTSSKVTIRNTRYSGIKDGLVMIGSTIYNSSSGNVTISNLLKY